MKLTEHLIPSVSLAVAVVFLAGGNAANAQVESSADAMRLVAPASDKVCVGMQCEEVRSTVTSASSSMSLCDLLLGTQICAAIENIQVGRGISFTIGNVTYGLSESSNHAVTLSVAATRSSGGVTTSFGGNLTCALPGYLLAGGEQVTVGIMNTTVGAGLVQITRVGGYNNSNLASITLQQTINGQIVRQFTQNVTRSAGAGSLVAAAAAAFATTLPSIAANLWSQIEPVLQQIVNWVLPLLP